MRLMYFTCLLTQDVQIEVVEQLRRSAFINSVRWCDSILGLVKTYRFNWDTNFIDTTEYLDAINVEYSSMKKYVDDCGTTWLLNNLCLASKKGLGKQRRPGCVISSGSALFA
ncbi:hypothetical protein DPMN_118266 [Dreissena polymorpha]|uniref:Uncharacterized protein n=1 Tax=Dreissena polymorpha TaxID=45954 RepID=A0A9D4GGL1_DREPO|nr:hypothetical protein DPMN_118266 [Dreissena polymorpha]